MLTGETWDVRLGPIVERPDGLHNPYTANFPPKLIARLETSAIPLHRLQGRSRDGFPGTYQGSTHCNLSSLMRAARILTVLSLKESCRIQIRWRRCRIAIRDQCRPSRTSPQTRPRDDRPRQGSLLLQEPCGKLRVSSVPDGPPERWLLPRPHPGPQTPDEPCATCGPRTKGREEPGPVFAAGGHGRAGQEADHQDRTAGLQDHQDSGPVDATAGAAVPVAVSGDHAGGATPGAFHVGVRAEGRGAARQKLPVSCRGRGAVPDMRFQAAGEGDRSPGRSVLDLVRRGQQGILGADYVQDRARRAVQWCSWAGSGYWIIGPHSSVARGRRVLFIFWLQKLRVCCSLQGFIKAFQDFSILF